MKDFVPLGHENIDIKNKLIDYARKLKEKEGFENQLAASFIYTSFTEYIAKNLLENLRYFTYKGTYTQYAGILYIDEIIRRYGAEYLESLELLLSDWRILIISLLAGTLLSLTRT